MKPWMYTVLVVALLAGCVAGGWYANDHQAQLFKFLREQGDLATAAWLKLAKDFGSIYVCGPFLIVGSIWAYPWLVAWYQKRTSENRQSAAGEYVS